MPKVDGRAFFYRARGAGYQGPVVVCSAWGAKAAQRELGADAALDKPFEPDDLVDSIKEVLSQETSAQAQLEALGVRGLAFRLTPVSKEMVRDRDRPRDREEG